MNTNATIELRGTGVYTRWTCDICGEQQEKDGMHSRIVVLEEHGMDSHYDICRACLDAGKKGAAARSRKHAEQLEELSVLHKKGIPNILRMVSEWKSGKDYDAVCKAFDGELCAAMGGNPELPPPPDTSPENWDIEWEPSFAESL